jgi:hypothetical protein
MTEAELKAYIDALPAAKKARMVELFRKKKLAEKEHKLEGFVPNPGVQANFLSSPAKIRAMFAGNAVGKTTAIIIELLWQHLGLHPIRDTSNTHHTWMLVPSFEKAEDYWNEIVKWCPPSQLPDTDKMGTSHIRRFRWKNGSITTIFSFDQDPSKLEGTNISGLFIDEPPPRSLWVAAYRGLRANPNYFIAIAATPISEAWLYQEIYLPWSLGQDKNIEVFTGSSYENPHIPKEWLDDFSSRLSAEERRSRIHGEFSMLQGRVFGAFSRSIHVISSTQEWPAEWPVWVCIDPHVRKPHAALYMGRTPDNNMVILDELKITGTIKDLAAALIAKNKAYNVQAIYIDTKGVEADWSRSSAIEILSANGIYCSSVGKQAKDVMSGINKIKALLVGAYDPNTGELIPQLKVMENCVNTITEFEMYAWAESRHPEKSGIAEKPRKTFDDYMDCLRYLIAKNLSGSVELEEIDAFRGIGYNKDYEQRSRR